MQQKSPITALKAKVRLRCRLSDAALIALDDLASQYRLSRSATVNALTPEWCATLRFVVPGDEAPLVRHVHEQLPMLSWQSLNRLLESPEYKRHPTALYPTIDNIVLLAEWAEQLPKLSYRGADLPTARAALALEIILRGWVAEVVEEE